MKMNEMIGQKFGRLTVISQAEYQKDINNKRVIMWNCICDCGNTTVVSSSKLKSGNTKSCGCYKRESAGKNKLLDLTNQRFGKLTAIKRAENIGEKTTWLCKCDCGQEVIVKTAMLRNGEKTSCGCDHQEKIEKKIEDLTGRTFNYLTVLQRADDKYRTYNGKSIRTVFWRCKCKCGNETIASSGALKSGHVRSCGCLKSEMSRKSKFKDLTGQRFGRLVVIKEAEKYTSPQGHNYTMWECLCDCGNVTQVLSSHLSSGKIVSCGCFSAEVISKIKSKNLEGLRFGKLIVLRKANKNHQKGKRIIWECQCDCGNIVYVNTNCLTQNNTQSCGCSFSKGEYRIQEYFNKKNITFVKQKSFDDLRGINNGKLRYDFFVPMYNVLIEFQGKQHYEIVDFSGDIDISQHNYICQQEHDRRKREYAESNGYNLLEIPYYDYDNIEEILDKALSTSEVGNS